VLIFQFEIVVCVFALPDKLHAFSYWVKRDEYILSVLKRWESTGRNCDIAYCLDRY